MDTEERLAKLERELLAEKRHNRWLLAVLGLGVVGVLAWTLSTTTPTAQAQGANSGPKVIRAIQFNLEDETGKTRAMLAMSKDGPALSLNNETRKPRVMLGVSKDGPGLTLHDETGKLRATLHLDKVGAGLAVYDENGKAIWSQP